VVAAVNADRREFRHIGKPMRVAEDARFVRGRGMYINDVEFPGMLHLGVMSAPVAHARILSVDTAQARELPGVVAVLTGDDIVRLMEPIPQEQDMFELPGVRWFPLAVEKIRYAGEWIAAIVATSRAIAEDAAELVNLSYEELPPVVDPELAMQPDAPVLHEAHGSNIVWQQTSEWGEVDAAFARAPHVLEHRLRWHRHSGVPLETFGCVVHPRPDGMLDVWASHQNPGIQQEMMDVLRRSSVRVNMDLDVGGSYGSKRGRKQMYLTSVAALMTQRPVKFIEDRLENMQAGDGHGPDRLYTVKVAFDGEGVIQALDVHLVDDLGAYCGRGPRQIAKPLVAVVGPYRIKHVRYDVCGVLTCKTNQVPFRGSGQSPHNFVLERTMDRVAAELGLDPIEIRRRNYIQANEFPYTIPTGAVYDSGDYEGAMRLAVDRADLAGLRAKQADWRAEGRLIGIGVAGAIEPSGVRADPEAVRVQIDRRGRVVATIGFQSSGQSHESMVIQVLCEELGVAPTDVTVQRAHGLNGIVGGATVGSRMTLMLGGALHAGSEKVRDKLRAIAANVLEASPEDITVDGSRYHVAGSPGKALELVELADIAYNRRYLLPEGMEPGIVETAVYPGPGGPGSPSLPPERRGIGFPSYGFDFHVVLVEIDSETYEIRFLDYVVVHDCGTVINPLVVDGFVFGGIGHGVGGALYENFIYDELGFLRAATFMDYLMPTAAEVPRVRLYSMETPSPLHPYGAKGTAEGAYMTAPAAIASAVEDALSPLGIVVDEIPITPTGLFDRAMRDQPEANTATGRA
jgi:3-oxo-Delta1-steroid hydratase/dehydrogenase large subunit